MTLRKGHGTGKGVPRVEVLPADELPAPVPAQPEPVRRRSNGTIADSATAKLLGARGGAAKTIRARRVSALGLADLAADAAFAPYYALADEFARTHHVALEAVAGGEVSPGTASIVASAGVQLAASRFLSDRAAKDGDAKLFVVASSLANDSRQNILAAYEIATREAKARATKPRNPLEALLAAGDQDTDDSEGGS